MKYVYGPVRSRRLGSSLGVSLTPHKVCNFDCIYCQQGKGYACFGERKEYVRVEEVLEEVRAWLQAHPAEAQGLDYITLSGSGEPTLNTKIAELISSLKEVSPAPVAVITNASLLGLSEVRQALLKADLIVPSLDAVFPEVFQINSPVRTTAEEGVAPAEKRKLNKIKEILGEKCEII
jgi:wyosine [tRNA(Phe)-imidazoG37] synthetase (radical SAM superfamily)